MCYQFLSVQGVIKTDFSGVILSISNFIMATCLFTRKLGRILNRLQLVVFIIILQGEKSCTQHGKMIKLYKSAVPIIICIYCLCLPWNLRGSCKFQLKVLIMLSKLVCLVLLDFFMTYFITSYFYLFLRQTPRNYMKKQLFTTEMFQVTLY